MHIPVLLHEIIEGLEIQKGDVVLDGTVGGGGYTKALCDQVGEKGTVIGLDQDGTTLAQTRQKLEKTECTLHLVRSNFRNLDSVLESLAISNIDGLVFDLGLSSLQLEESGRGFSFLKDEPLYMTFSETPETSLFTAGDIINSWEEETIANIIFGYGEERYSRRIAKAIVQHRERHPIQTTKELAEIIKDAVPAVYRRGPIHPATRTFQALRIAVNDELEALSEGLSKGYEALAPKGRMVIVSFHSLEDRIVKNFYKEKSLQGSTILTKKPIVPTLEEQKHNPRSRSAKLRILEK